MSATEFHLSNMVINKLQPMLNYGRAFPIIQVDNDRQIALCSFIDTGAILKTSYFDFKDLTLVSLTQDGFF
jgi:hypothetical protein